MKGSMKNIIKDIVMYLYIFSLYITMVLYLFIGFCVFSLSLYLTIENEIVYSESQIFFIFYFIILCFLYLSIKLILKAKNKTNATVIDYFVAFVPHVGSVITYLIYCHVS